MTELEEIRAEVADLRRALAQLTGIVFAHNGPNMFRGRQTLSRIHESYETAVATEPRETR